MAGQQAFSHGWGQDASLLYGGNTRIEAGAEHPLRQAVPHPTLQRHTWMASWIALYLVISASKADKGGVAAGLLLAPLPWPPA